ncbi:MAG: DUF2842 domain-containing protein [Sphingomonadales bacterium]|nr:MAG: DUF2842 domain-containing protein [Sphingomonadales bacterium]
MVSTGASGYPRRHLGRAAARHNHRKGHVVAQHLEPSWRKPAGAIGMILWILVWTILIVTGSRWIGSLHILLQLPIYLVAGVVWILPLRPVMIWMETGRWRA